MQVPAERIILSLRRTMDRLLGTVDSFGSDQEAVRSALNVLYNRETSGVATQQEWLGQIAGRMQALEDELGLRERAPDLHQRAGELRTAAGEAATLTSIEAIEAAGRQLMTRFARLAGDVTADPRLDAEARARTAEAIGRWDAARIAAMGRGRSVERSAASTEISQEALAAYLADRFSEPGITVTAMRNLSGGFGKETILFTVDGKALSGDCVMRRDRSEPTLDNDCHRIANEYPVIRAAFAHGFPAPDALWLDTEHRLLPGGDFIVMRRAPGSPGGDVFSAESAISDDLLNVLAGALAGLHSLPPLTELGDLTDSISEEMWSLSLQGAARRYIEGFRDIYVNDMVEPAPAILALYSWVLDRLPDVPGRPVLVHGDVGFHNMIVHEGRLSALVDWEFAHVGDPAEDLAYVRNTAGHTLDWAKFMAAYRAAGGVDVDPERIQVFQVWGQLRNATASSLTINCLMTGRMDELKFAHTGFYHAPMFVNAACDVIAAGPDRTAGG